MNLKTPWVPISLQVPAIKEGLLTLLEWKGLRQSGWVSHLVEGRN